jgi:hypothetical protein
MPTAGIRKARSTTALPSTLARELMTICEAGEEQARVLRPIPVPDDILVGFQVADKMGQSEDGGTLLVAQIVPLLKFAHHRCEDMVWIV